MLMTALLGVWLVANVLWTMRNWLTHRDRMKFYRLMDVSSDSIKLQAQTLVREAQAKAEANAQKFFVCEQCGKIVQGVCLACMTQEVTHG